MDRENGDGDIEGGGADDGGFRSSIGRKYRPVLANDRAVLEMSSIDQGSSSSASAFPDQNPNLRKVNTSVNGSSDAKEENLSHEQKPNGSRQQESKLELFGFDSLVNILGLKSMTGEHVTQPSSPRDGEDISITAGLPKPAAPKLGTLMGVFIPCIQSILGIIYYIRFSWIVGMAGIGETLLLVSLCGACTFLTSISLSAIATNGAMKGGGPYYLIGRALGPEVGVSIGLCFFLGNAVAGALYVLGAVETFLKAVPSAGIFRETVTQVNGTAIAQPIESPSSHDLQIYGIVLTILLCFIVFGGVKMINRVAPAFLIPVLFSVVCIFLGIFLAGKDHPSEGITGLSSETFKENWSADYQKTNDAGIPETDGSVTWNFNSLVGLFFPAVTGIMAGSNRSSSLRDTQQSIPVGTLAATLTTTSLYLVSLMLFGAVATREKLLTDRLLTATIAWPFPSLIKIGIILSTMGAALQSLTGAPRLLAAIANDDILPILNYFKVGDGGEPHVATFFTAFLCIGCVVIGNLDLITPTVTMFFLLCYTGVNLSCFLLDLLDAPSWRPRWKFHHWSLSLVGALLCIVIMFLISWSFTVVSLLLASLIYKYVSIKGKAGDWGDGFKSAYFQLALRSLRSLGASQVHPKNWYPIPLVFCRPWGKLPENVPCHPKLADFANCMKKKGRGMSIFVSILDGDYHECAEDAKTACKQLSTYIDYKNCEGVAEIVVAPNMSEGFRGIIQTMGLGNLKPNIVVMRYPEIWRRENLIEIPATFVGIINDCIVANKAVVIVKGLDEWPNEYQRQYGTIDLYWIVRDGGLMLLLSQLLLTKESFENCKIQVFCIAEDDADAEGLKADVKKFLYDLRMQAEVFVITMKWDAQMDGGGGSPAQDESMDAFTSAQQRIDNYLTQMKATAEREGTPLMADGKPVVVNEKQVEKFLYTTLKLNSTILRYSRMAAVVLVSLPPPPVSHPAYFYMEYMDPETSQSEGGHHAFPGGEKDAVVVSAASPKTATKGSKFPFYSPSPLPSLFKNSPANSSVSSTPLRLFKRPFPPPSPAKHIRALLARRHGSVKPNEASIPEGSECEVGLDKSFGFSSHFQAHFELGPEVGRGHFGYTCSAKGRKGTFKGHDVAVKVIPKSKMTTAIAIEDVRREVKILQALTGHKNLVQFYEAYEDNDNVYIVMELCKGGELLDKILSRGGKYSEEDARIVMIQILSVVAFCHLQGVVHRDLKPENFLYISKDENSTLKVIDFGLSDYVKPDERLNDIVGSAYYVAPEVLHRSYGTEADMWSIGVIAYILLCGSRPFWARTESGIFRAVLKADPSFEEAPWPSLSADAKDFVKRLLNKDYRKRLTAAQALSHPWLVNHCDDVKIPFDMIIHKLVKTYICSSSLRKSALGALAKTLTLVQLAYLREQFNMLGPNKSGLISMQNFKTAILRSATDASKDSRVLDYVNMVSSIQYRKLDFEEFCAAAISVHQLEGMESWEQHARRAYEMFEKEGNRPIMIEELASELGLSPSVPIHVVLQDWIRHSDGKLSFLGFVRLLHGVSSRTFQKA